MWINDLHLQGDVRPSGGLCFFGTDFQTPGKDISAGRMIDKDNNIQNHFFNVDVLSKQAEKKAELLVKEYSCILNKEAAALAADAGLMQKVFMEASIVDFGNDIPGLVVLDDKLITVNDSKIIDAIENWTPQHRSKDFLSN